MAGLGPRRNERGVVAPSPVVMLSIVAVAMAGVAFVATRGNPPTEREITSVSRNEPTHSASATATPTPKPHPKPEKPAVRRSKVYVEVYNNTGVNGLAGRVATKATGIGWQVVGTDDWYGGNIPANTVYYPQRLKAAAKVLALDLGIRRLEPAVDPMRLDRLTIILTGELP